jgi:hypothetical protein
MLLEGFAAFEKQSLLHQQPLPLGRSAALTTRDTCLFRRAESSRSLQGAAGHVTMHTRSCGCCPGYFEKSYTSHSIPALHANAMWPLRLPPPAVAYYRYKLPRSSAFV